MPGQLAALERRIELLVSAREQSLRQLAAATDEAAALSQTSDDAPGAGRALKRAARLRTDRGAPTREIDTLRPMVAAPLAPGQPPRRGPRGPREGRRKDSA